jgi:hypothetical protein
MNTADVATADSCHVNGDFSTNGTLAGSSETVAYGPFTLSTCTGAFTGTLSYSAPNFLRVRLEKQNAGGSWTTADGPTTSIGYTGGPGTFRYVVQNLLSTGASWSLAGHRPIT